MAGIFDEGLAGKEARERTDPLGSGALGLREGVECCIMYKLYSCIVYNAV